jgi:hypothetical protein
MAARGLGNKYMENGLYFQLIARILCFYGDAGENSPHQRPPKACPHALGWLSLGKILPIQPPAQA